MPPIYGTSTVDNTPAVFGDTTLFEGVRGVGHSAVHGAVVGSNDAGTGVFGTSLQGEGVHGDGQTAGVSGFSQAGDGVVGKTTSSNKNAIFASNNETLTNTVRGGGNGMSGRTTVPNGSGVFGVNDSGSADGAGVSGFSTTQKQCMNSLYAGVERIVEKDENATRVHNPQRK